MLLLMSHKGLVSSLMPKSVRGCLAHRFYEYFMTGLYSVSLGASCVPRLWCVKGHQKHKQCHGKVNPTFRISMHSLLFLRTENALITFYKKKQSRSAISKIYFHLSKDIRARLVPECHRCHQRRSFVKTSTSNYCHKMQINLKFAYGIERCERLFV